MTHLHYIPSEAGMDAYRAGLTGERIGYALHTSPGAFSPSHRILVDPEEGPVIIVGDDVWLVEAEDDVFSTEDEARDAYWARKQGQ